MNFLHEMQDVLLSSTHFIILLKLFIALLLGAIIGLERELKHKPVGVKTCAIIAITTCILTVISIQSAEYYAQISENIRTDPMRLAAQVVSGIGFLGAGVILRKSNDAISGLTTAAIIWAAAGIGIASGAGFFFDAVMATAMILVAIRLSPIVQRFVHNRQKAKEKKAVIRVYVSQISAMTYVTDLLLVNNFPFENFTMKEQGNGEIKLSYRYGPLTSETLERIYSLLKQQAQVLRVDVEN
ncbi:MgtC/SapB family protein [Bisgaard Taxon 10/6]|uniref:MgtC/SapB family protein n=1 Tax=Exercitatus varius TaxID=67857 RepID=UPI0018A5F473|nr:MgtC/SapB family protein [Exercitatus varius]QOF67521.1 MgtC/SapB family protein [Actinobacillus sp. GY-402]MDG2914774.1 MgtC/SapB family protein [Exercitatus varius]MDG2917052.1 MgtC/SapB family protein [Exercitatus varius]MDG2942251.1 MgtC/SapB family protein [Exercitatus varius]MDG2944542.1 MgtC/SapB family protein [Exercitatus varius]